MPIAVPFGYQIKLVKYAGANRPQPSPMAIIISMSVTVMSRLIRLMIDIVCPTSCQTRSTTVVEDLTERDYGRHHESPQVKLMIAKTA